MCAYDALRNQVKACHCSFKLPQNLDSTSIAFILKRLCSRPYFLYLCWKKKTPKPHPWNYRLYRNGNFWEGISISQVMARAKAKAHLVPSKNPTGFSLMFVFSQSAVFLVFYCVVTCKYICTLRLCVIIYMIHFLTCAQLRLCLCSTSEKASLSSYFQFLSS